MAASEDLPHLKILAAAIRAAKADIGNAFHTGPGLDIRDRPCGVFASFENIWLLKSFDPPSPMPIKAPPRAVCAV